jgi:hypothetical protein
VFLLSQHNVLNIRLHLEKYSPGPREEQDETGMPAAEPPESRKMPCEDAASNEMLSCDVARL